MSDDGDPSALCDDLERRVLAAQAAQHTYTRALGEYNAAAQAHRVQLMSDPRDLREEARTSKTCRTRRREAQRASRSLTQARLAVAGDLNGWLAVVKLARAAKATAAPKAPRAMLPAPTMRARRRRNIAYTADMGHDAPDLAPTRCAAVLPGQGVYDDRLRCQCSRRAKVVGPCIHGTVRSWCTQHAPAPTSAPQETHDPL